MEAASGSLGVKEQWASGPPRSPYLRSNLGSHWSAYPLALSMGSATFTAHGLCGLWLSLSVTFTFSFTFFHRMVSGDR